MYAVATLQAGGQWELDIPGDVQRAKAYENLAQVISAAEMSWQEHSITLHHIDAQLDEANRQV